MPNERPALAGIDGLLWIIEQMMRSLDDRLAPSPPSGMLARLCRLLSGKALADQAARATCAMLRAKFATLASSLCASLTADLPSPATEGGPEQDVAEVPLSGNAGAGETGAPPIACGLAGDAEAASIVTDRAPCADDAASMADAWTALAIIGGAACNTLGGGAGALPGSGASEGTLATKASVAGKSLQRTEDEGRSALNAKAALPGASRAGAWFDAEKRDVQVHAIALRARTPALVEICVSGNAPHRQTARTSAASDGVRQDLISLMCALPRRARWRQAWEPDRPRRGGARGSGEGLDVARQFG